MQDKGKSHGDADVQLVAPRDCYLKGENIDTLYSVIFVFVDFGPKANGFLRACGAKNEPSVEAIVQVMLASPVRYYKMTGGGEK